MQQQQPANKQKRRKKKINLTRHVSVAQKREMIFFFDDCPAALGFDVKSSVRPVNKRYTKIETCSTRHRDRTCVIITWWRCYLLSLLDCTVILRTSKIELGNCLNIDISYSKSNHKSREMIKRYIISSWNETSESDTWEIMSTSQESDVYGMMMTARLMVYE